MQDDEKPNNPPEPPQVPAEPFETEGVEEAPVWPHEDAGPAVEPFEIEENE